MGDSLSIEGGWNYRKVKINSRFYVCEVYYDNRSQPVSYAGGPPDEADPEEWLPSGDTEAMVLVAVQQNLINTVLIDDEEGLKDAVNMLRDVTRSPLLDVSEIGVEEELVK